MRRFFFPVLMGVVGVAILLALGTWQVRRLEWKTGILAEMNARLTAAPQALPASPDPEADRWLPVTATGALTGEEVRILTSAEGRGAGYRVIDVFETGGRRVLADLGFVPLEAETASRAAPRVTVSGNLNWPQEADGWTPDPDPERGLWFARDVLAMAEALGTEPLLIQARTVSGADLGVTPLPVDTSAVPNDHLGYAITWFGLAAMWAAMTGFLIRRVAARGRKD